MKTNKFNVPFCKVDLLRCEETTREFLRSTGCNVWFSPGVVDLVARITIDNPFMDIKENSVLFRHQIEGSSYVPFMTYVPTTGVDKSQVFCLSSKTKRKEVKKHLGGFFALFEKYNSYEDIFPKDHMFLVSPYITRYSSSSVTTICLYFETDDNTWNFFEEPHPLEFQSSSMFFSSSSSIPGMRDESLLEWVCRQVKLK